MADEFEITGEITDVVKMVEKLLGEGGCPWDRERVLEDFPEYIGNESKELIEAIEDGDWAHVGEEVGDLLFITVFLCKVAEKQGRFELSDSVKGLMEKMIRRHPHVFGDVNVANPDEVVNNWNEIKKREKEGG